ncbi:hypothetical protein, partial [Tenacibaculum sp. MAR_2009_124]|uniref:hypothetical protein n=1 Tax=Tenacibaculum sp. MAR_2009_124 TaxID=1250059 RepID=UPI001C40B38C
MDDSLYLAIPDINYETTKILMKIKEIAKAKKLIISFTGSKDIDGYLRDLQFISFLTQDNFNVSI